jgi:hypothetical protein
MMAVPMIARSPMIIRATTSTVPFSLLIGLKGASL